MTSVKTDFFRLTDSDIIIPIPAFKRPTLKEMKKCWDFVHSIENDDSPEEQVVMRLSTVLKSTESRIDGKTYEDRTQQLRADGRLLGLQHQQWFLENYKDFPKIVKSALNTIRCINFGGTTFELMSGSRGIFCIKRNGKRWNESGQWLDSGVISFKFNTNSRMAVSSK